MSARKRSRHDAGVLGAVSRFDRGWRRRRDAFWLKIEKSRYGPAVNLILVALFFVLGLVLLFNTVEALSTGVIHARRSRAYLSDNPSLFWTNFVWNMAIGVLMVGGVILGLWVRFGTVRGKRNAAQRRRRAKKKSTNSE